MMFIRSAWGPDWVRFTMGDLGWQGCGNIEDQGSGANFPKYSAEM
jgi:hypothetical protein